MDDRLRMGYIGSAFEWNGVALGAVVLGVVAGAFRTMRCYLLIEKIAQLAIDHAC